MGFERCELLGRPIESLPIIAGSDRAEKEPRSQHQANQETQDELPAMSFPQRSGYRNRIGR